MARINSAISSVTVINPDFSEVQVDFKVTFLCQKVAPEVVDIALRSNSYSPSTANPITFEADTSLSVNQELMDLLDEFETYGINSIQTYQLIAYSYSATIVTAEGSHVVNGIIECACDLHLIKAMAYVAANLVESEQVPSVLDWTLFYKYLNPITPFSFKSTVIVKLRGFSESLNLKPAPSFLQVSTAPPDDSKISNVVRATYIPVHIPSDMSIIRAYAWVDFADSDIGEPIKLYTATVVPFTESGMPADAVKFRNIVFNSISNDVDLMHNLLRDNAALDLVIGIAPIERDNLVIVLDYSGNSVNHNSSELNPVIKGIATAMWTSLTPFLAKAYAASHYFVESQESEAYELIVQAQSDPNGLKGHVLIQVQDDNFNYAIN